MSPTSKPIFYLVFLCAFFVVVVSAAYAALPEETLCKDTGGSWLDGFCTCPDGTYWSFEKGCVEGGENTLELCKDGIDNDDDGQWAGMRLVQRGVAVPPRYELPIPADPAP